MVGFRLFRPEGSDPGGSRDCPCALAVVRQRLRDLTDAVDEKLGHRAATAPLQGQHSHGSARGRQLDPQRCAQQCLQSLPALARSGRRAARLLVEAPRGPPELRQPYMRLILDSVTIDHHDARLEEPPVVLEKLLQTGASKSLPEGLSFAHEWRAGVVKGENWTATMARRSTVWSRQAPLIKSRALAHPEIGQGDTRKIQTGPASPDHAAALQDRDDDRTFRPPPDRGDCRWRKCFPAREPCQLVACEVEGQRRLRSRSCDKGQRTGGPVGLCRRGRCKPFR